MTVARRSVHELQETLEELSTATEELRAQNEELAELRLEVEQERQRYLELFDLAPDAYLVTDTRGTIREANRAAAALLGVGAHRIRGKPLAVFVPTASRPGFRTWLSSVERDPHPHVDHGPTYVREMVLQPRAGDPVPVEVTIGRIPDGAAGLAGLRWLIRDATLRKQAEAALRQLAARLEVAREQERKVVARDIHDQLGQVLTALRMDLAWLKGRLPQGEPTLADKAGGMLRAVEETIRSVRRIATELRPPILDDVGLAAAIEWLADDLATRTGIHTEMRLDELRLDEGRATTVFRILQEALTNVARHARAKTVAIRLQADNAVVTLEVADDGRGIPAAAATDGRALGLLGMRERAMSWGGTLDTQSQPGKGTTITLRIPLEDAARGGES